MYQLVRTLTVGEEPTQLLPDCQAHICMIRKPTTCAMWPHFCPWIIYTLFRVYPRGNSIRRTPLYISINLNRLLVSLSLPLPYQNRVHPQWIRHKHSTNLKSQHALLTSLIDSFLVSSSDLYHEETHLHNNVASLLTPNTFNSPPCVSTWQLWQ